MTADVGGAQADIWGHQDVWGHQGAMSDRGGPHFEDLIAQVRRLQETVVASRLPDDAAERAARHIAEIADTLAAHEVSPLDAPAGARLDLPGRGHPLLPSFVVDRWTEHEVWAHVTFTRYFLGGNGAATGGAHAVLFNDILGRLSVSGRPLSRTAYVHVNYHHVTPIGRRLDVEASVDRIEGRKRFISGRLLDGQRVVADAEGLFVELLPGQP